MWMSRTSDGKRWYFFFNDTATTEIYTLSLHDALPIYEAEDGYDSVEWAASLPYSNGRVGMCGFSYVGATQLQAALERSEEHTFELQSRQYLVCRLLLEKKNFTMTLLHFLPHYLFPSLF